jgi:hypothetical protein
MLCVCVSDVLELQHFNITYKASHMSERDKDQDSFEVEDPCEDELGIQISEDWTKVHKLHPVS